MANWNNPTTSTLYTDFPAEIKDRDVELARGLDPNTCSPYPTNLPTNALRWTASGGNYKLRSYNGSVWADATGLAMSITGSAATLTTTRTFSISGDGTAAAQNFNGSANVVLSLTLGTVAVAKGGTSFSSYAIGDMIYASGTGALSKLNIGSSGQVMSSSGTAPQWVAQSSLAVGSATTATTATNLAGGGAGQIPYQNSAGQTFMLGAGTSGYVLQANGASAPTWVAQNTLSVSSAASATTAGACSGNAATATTASACSGNSATATQATKAYYNNPRVNSYATATSITPNVDSYDIHHMTNTQAAGTFTVNNPSGTPFDGQSMILRLKCTNAQTYSWGSSYRGSLDLSLPTVGSSGSKTDYLGFKYNSTDSKWDLLSSVAGF
jgi:hypothetical protein